MAAITITRTLDPLISVFNTQTIEFTIDTGVIPTITVSSYDFMPVRTVIDSGGLDTYVMDFTDILKYIIGLPPTTFAFPYLTLNKSLAVTITAAATTTVTINTVLCYGFSSIGEQRIYNAVPNSTSVYSKGRYDVQYTDSGICSFYFSGVDGTYEITLSGVTPFTATLKNGYNSMSWFGNRFGTYTVTIKETGAPFTTYCVFTVKSFSAAVTNQITWINKDGSVSNWYFKLKSIDNMVTDSNNIPLYNILHTNFISKDRNISKDNRNIINLYTVAKDATHFQQLIDMKKSLTILGFDKLLKVISAPTEVSDCRQNLRFDLSLEYEDYVQSY